MNRPRPTRTLTIGSLETLDERIVPSGTGITALPVATQEAFVTTRAGQALGSIYTQYVNYEAAGASGSFTPTQANQIYTSGTAVGVDIRFSGGDFNTLVGQLKGIGMQVTATAPQYGLVEGYLPDSQLPVVASNGYATTISPVYKPVANVVTPTTSSNSTDEALVTNRGGQNLGTIYTEYVNYELAGAQGNFTSSLSNRIFMDGMSVGVDIRFDGGDFNTMIAQLEGLGMQVTATSAQYSLVEGFLPISQLPVVANDGYVSSLSPIYKPSLN